MSFQPSYSLETVRKSFPVTDHLIYLNHASSSPVPLPAQTLMEQAAQQLGADPGVFFGPHPDPRFGDIFVNLSTTVAELINAADMVEVVGVQSTSMAINTVAQSIGWQPGDNVVFSRMEFPSNAYPWMILERRGVEARIVPDDGSGGPSVELFAPHVDERTRVIAVSAVQFLSGYRADLAALGAFCHERGILFVVDAIQSAAHIPIDVQAMHIDVLASGGQKSLMGPSGQGFLYVRRELSNTLLPGIIGPNATEGWEFWMDYDLTPRDGAFRFMLGTPNVIGMVGLTASIRFLRELGIENIDAWTQHLSRVAIDDLEARGCTVITSRDHLGPIVTFRLSDVDPMDRAAMETLDSETTKLAEALAANNVRFTRHLDMQAVPHIRISTHCYNTETEVRRVGAIMEEIYG